MESTVATIKRRGRPAKITTTTEPTRIKRKYTRKNNTAASPKTADNNYILSLKNENRQLRSIIRSITDIL